MRQHPPAVAQELASRAADLLRERQPQQDQAAREMLLQVTGPDEGSASDWFHLGIAEERLNDYEAASGAYQRALEVEPAFYHCLIAASALALKRWRFADSWQYFLRAVATGRPKTG